MYVCVTPWKRKAVSFRIIDKILYLYFLDSIWSAVRMARRSKAPHSRLDPQHWCNAIQRAFWSPFGGVGSNPTPNRKLLRKATLHSNEWSKRNTFIHGLWCCLLPRKQYHDWRTLAYIGAEFQIEIKKRKTEKDQVSHKVVYEKKKKKRSFLQNN